MTLQELKIKWENRIYSLTEQLNSTTCSDCERLLIKEEREVLIKCLKEINDLENEQRN